MLLTLLRLPARPVFVSTLARAALMSTSTANPSGKIAVVLSGCGVFDGAEVHESAAALAAITRQGFEPVVYAPDKDQAHVVDHTSGSEQSDHTRNVLKESSRIARTAATPLAELSGSGDIKAVVFPGGFGAAKNLSDFGFKGAEMTVDPEVERVVRDFRAAGKPMAFCCIAPVVAAKVLGQDGVRMTMGKKGEKWPYGDAIDAAKSFGAEMVDKDVDEVCVDERNSIVSTPAYMYDGKFHEIQDGVTRMVGALVKLIK